MMKYYMSSRPQEKAVEWSRSGGQGQGADPKVTTALSLPGARQIAIDRDFDSYSSNCPIQELDRFPIPIQRKEK